MQLWKDNIMDVQICGNCKYWKWQTGGRGECKRHAPMTPLMVTTTKQFEIWGMWPTVDKENWCGEWEKKNEQVPNDGL